MITPDAHGTLVQTSDDDNDALNLDLTGLDDDRGAFISLVPIVDISYMDEEFIHTSLIDSGMAGEGLTESDERLGIVFDQYVEWNTGWNHSPIIAALSEYVVQVTGLAKGIAILFKTRED